MSDPIYDLIFLPEESRLHQIAEELKKKYKDRPDPWELSPFRWIKRLPAPEKGKVGEDLMMRYLTEIGLAVVKVPDSEADFEIGGVRTEFKFSMLWKARTYKFQQIRDQNYDLCVCLGLSPFKAHAWAITKDMLHEHVIGKRPQHGGAKGRDTFWLTVDPEEPERFLWRCGGSLLGFHEALRLWLPTLPGSTYQRSLPLPIQKQGRR